MNNIEKHILTLPSINQCFLFRFTEDAYIKRDQSEDELLNAHPTISESNITPLYFLMESCQHIYTANTLTNINIFSPQGCPHI